MKHVLFYALAAVLFFTPSCTKQDQESNYWIINGNKVIALNVARVPSTTPYLLSINGSNTLSIHFSDFPTSSGSYKVVTSDSLPKSGEMAITSVYKGLAYGSTGYDNVTVPVTIASGKISIDLPNVRVKSTTDSVQVSGKLAEF